MAKPRIRLTTPYDSPETLVFRYQKERILSDLELSLYIRDIQMYGQTDVWQCVLPLIGQRHTKAYRNPHKVKCSTVCCPAALVEQRNVRHWSVAYWTPTHTVQCASSHLDRRNSTNTASASTPSLTKHNSNECGKEHYQAKQTSHTSHNIQTKTVVQLLTKTWKIKSESSAQVTTTSVCLYKRHWYKCVEWDVRLYQLTC